MNCRYVIQALPVTLMASIVVVMVATRIVQLVQSKVRALPRVCRLPCGHLSWSKSAALARGVDRSASRA